MEQWDQAAVASLGFFSKPLLSDRKRFNRNGPFLDNEANGSRTRNIVSIPLVSNVFEGFFVSPAITQKSIRRLRVLLKDQMHLRRITNAIIFLPIGTNLESRAQSSNHHLSTAHVNSGSCACPFPVLLLGMDNNIGLRFFFCAELNYDIGSFVITLSGEYNILATGS